MSNRETKEAGDDILKLTTAISEKMAEKGLWAQLAIMKTFGGVFRIAPPITTSEEELQEGLRIMEEAFAETEGSMPLYDTGRGNEVLERAAL